MLETDLANDLPVGIQQDISDAALLQNQLKAPKLCFVQIIRTLKKLKDNADIGLLQEKQITAKILNKMPA